MKAIHFIYRPFHKTLPRSSAFVNWTSVRFYETSCMYKSSSFLHLFLMKAIHFLYNIKFYLFKLYLIFPLFFFVSQLRNTNQLINQVYQWKLLNHVAKDHNKTLKPAHLSYKCTVCTATFGQYKLFENHVYTAHSGVAKKADKAKQVGHPPGIYILHFHTFL